MVIRELDLPQLEPHQRPKLQLVPPPPPRGRPVAAFLGVVLIAGVLATPALRADRKESPPQAWPDPPLSGAMVAALDDGSVLLGRSRPTSSDPVGGMLFVRCTRLWSARPDGSHARKVLEMAGISSPVFSFDARSVAFFAPDGGAHALWIASAEGDHPRPIARLTANGQPVSAWPTSLTWSGNGKQLAFALVDPRFDPFGAGSSIWTYNLETGSFTRKAQGWPGPFFLPGRSRVAYASQLGGEGSTFHSVGRHGGSQRERRLSSDADEYTAAFVNHLFGDAWTVGRGVVILREVDGETVISVKRDEWRRGLIADHPAPPKYAIDLRSRLALAQDGSRALVDLRDGDGERDLGIVDLRTGEWTVLDYAWDATTSPAPTASGPLAAQRAARFASDLISSLGHRSGTAFSLLAADDNDREVIPFRVRGQVIGAPSRLGNDWTVPATVIGKVVRRQWAARAIEILVTDTADGRIVADASGAGAITPIETVEDAVAVAAKLIGERFAWPSYIPDGARLNARWPIDAWSWDDSLTVSVNLEVSSSDGKGFDYLSIAHGDVGFNLGCGGEIDPEEGTVAGIPALFDQTGPGANDTRQVLWPGTLEVESEAFYSVYGALSRDEIARIAASMVH